MDELISYVDNSKKNYFYISDYHIVDLIDYEHGSIEPQYTSKFKRKKELLEFTDVPITNTERSYSKVNCKLHHSVLKIKSIQCTTPSTIIVDKQYLHNEATSSSKTKMYLIKGDNIQILEEDDDWLYVLYQGKKNIKKWIPKSAIGKSE